MNGTQLRLLSSGSGLVTAIRMIVRLAILSETPSLAAPWGPAGWRQGDGQGKRHSPCLAVA